MSMVPCKRRISSNPCDDARIEVIEVILQEADLAIDRLAFSDKQSAAHQDLDFMAKASRQLGLQELHEITAITTGSIRDGQLLVRDKKRLLKSYQSAKASLRALGAC